MQRAALALLPAIALVAACAGPATVDERLAQGCSGGDQASCTALEERTAQTTATAPEVKPAPRRVVRDTRVGVGVSGGSRSGVGVGVSIGLGDGPWGY